MANNAVEWAGDNIKLTDSLSIPGKISFGAYLRIQKITKKDWSSIDWTDAGNMRLCFLEMARDNDPGINETAFDNELNKIPLKKIMGILSQCLAMEDEGSNPPNAEDTIEGPLQE